MFVYHLPIAPPPPGTCHLLIWERAGREGGGPHGSDNVEDGVLTLSLNGAERRRKVHAFSVPKSQRCTDWVYLGSSALSFISAFRSGSGGVAGGGGFYLSYSHSG